MNFVVEAVRLVGPGRRMHLKFTDWSEGNNNVVWLLLTWKYYVSSVVFRLQDVVTISNPISHSWSLDLYFNPPDLTSRHELLKKLGSPNIFQNRWEIRRQKTLKWMYFKLSWLLFGLLVTPSTNYELSQHWQYHCERQLQDISLHYKAVFGLMTIHISNLNLGGELLARPLFISHSKYQAWRQNGYVHMYVGQ